MFQRTAESGRPYLFVEGETLAVLLKKEDFKGILVSDDAAVYQGFKLAQKCWTQKSVSAALLLRPEVRECELELLS